MNNTGCILTELAELLCTPEPALPMLLAPEIEENGFLSSWDGVGWDGTEWVWPAETLLRPGLYQ